MRPTAPYRVPSQGLLGLEARLEQLHGGSSEHPHIGFTIRHSGFYRQGALDRTGHGDAGVAGVIAIAIARGAARTRLTQAPGRTDVIADRAAQQGIGLLERIEAWDLDFGIWVVTP